jgi:REP element-mobilizing transposase RayT
MKYNPDIHHRRSIRLKGYDYAQAGAYFVTICAQDRLCLFGDVADGKMRLNAAGRMVDQWFGELNNKFRELETDEYVVMPNHFHGIIVIVGADLRVCPDQMGQTGQTGQTGEHTGSPLHGQTGQTGQTGEHTGSPLPKIIQWFKTMTTNEYIRCVKTTGWPPFPGKLWQRNYYEHVIRNENELNRVREYIINNPMKWELDRENPQQSVGADLRVCPLRVCPDLPDKDEPWLRPRYSLRRPSSGARPGCGLQRCRSHRTAAESAGFNKPRHT